MDLEASGTAAVVTAGELAGLLGTAGAPFLLDVREREEVAAWAIPGAANVPLGELPARLAEVPLGRAVVTVCASGKRSAVAARLLAAAGHEVANLEGGMAAWGMVLDTAAVDLGGVTVVQVRRRGRGCLSYLVGAGGEAFVVDPASDVDRYLGLAAERGWRVTRVFDTHLHADHLSGARALAAATGATLHLNPADPFAFPFEPLGDGDRFALPGGVEVAAVALPTPGHTEGSTAFLVGGRAVLTGDALFVDGVGRPDLAERAEEFARSLHASLHDRLLPLGEDVFVLPAHFGDRVEVRPGEPVAATIGALKAGLEPLTLGEEDFVAWITERVGERPANYRRIVEVNRGRSVVPEHLLAALESGPNRCSA